MKYLERSFTMPQLAPDPRFCCERCVFGRGEHAAWCEYVAQVRTNGADKPGE